MKEFKGTKGEWTVKEYKEDNYISIDLVGRIHNPSLASISPSEEVYEEATANAKLIGASPDLLQDLIDLVWLVDKGATEREITHRIIACNKTLSKALD